MPSYYILGVRAYRFPQYTDKYMFRFDVPEGYDLVNVIEFTVSDDDPPQFVAILALEQR
jgi:hypothetical protein